MRFGSVCSGIEAASVAWEPLGWRASWLAEIEGFPSAVLAHRHPGVPNLGDFTAIAARVRSAEIEAPEVFVGGTPCQAFSVAGLRRGLSDARGALSIAYVDLVNAIDAARSVRGEQPCIALWENVPGVLSSRDNAFGCFLGALAGEDCELQPPGGRWADAGLVLGPQRAIAWRLLDAQYFGLAQRRRRVFVVASAREGFDPGAVLFERQGLRRDSAPSREAGQRAAGAIARCSFSGGAGGRPEGAAAGHFIETAGTLRQSDGGSDVAHAQANHIVPAGPTEYLPQSSRVYLPENVAPTLQSSGDKMGNRAPQVLAFGGNNTSGPIDVTPALLAQPGSGWKGDFDSETFIAEPGQRFRCGACGDAFADPDATGAGGLAPAECPRCGEEQAVAAYTLTPDPAIPGSTVAVKTDIASPLTAVGEASKNGRGTHVVAFTCKDYGGDASEDLSPTLRAMGAGETWANGGGQVAVAIPIAESGKRTGVSSTDKKAGDGIGTDGDPMFTLGADSRHAVAFAFKASHYTRDKDGAPSEVYPPLSADADRGDQDPLICAPMAFAVRGRVDGAVPEVHGDGDTVGALRAASGGSSRDMVAFEVEAGATAYNFEHGLAPHGSLEGADVVAALSASEHKGHTAVHVAFQTRGSNLHVDEHISGTLGTNADRASGSAPMAFTVSESANGFAWESPVHPTLMAHPGSETSNLQYGVRVASAVRRLMPVECERLQGFPDGYTDIPWRGKPAGQCPDGPRYKALGNSMAVPCMAWIGARIAAVVG